MSKLFAGTEHKPLNLSFEQYFDAVRYSKTVSMETMSGFLSKIQDVMVSGFHSATFKYNDKAVAEVLSFKYQTLNQAKHLEFTTTSENVTSVPESFQGKYLLYIRDLSAVSEASIDEVFKLLTDFKIVIASFINNAAEDKIDSIYGIQTFKNAEKNLESQRKEIAKYFPSNTGKSKGSFRDVLFTYADFEHLFKEVEKMDNIVNYDLIQKLDKEVESIRSLIDMLIDLTRDGSITMNNEAMKKDLIMATFISGKYVEFMTYLMTNLLVFYAVFKNNCQDFHKL